MRHFFGVLLALLACGDPAHEIPQADTLMAQAKAAQAEADSKVITPVIDSVVAVRSFGVSIGFGSRKQLNDHVVKHGGEFGGITATEYLRRAQTLRDAPLSSDVLETIRADGSISRYQRSTGYFLAFNADGTIRTFFIPNDGEKYFLRQARRRPFR